MVASGGDFQLPVAQSTGSWPHFLTHGVASVKSVELEHADPAMLPDGHRFGLLAMTASFFSTDMLIVFPATTHLFTGELLDAD